MAAEEARIGVIGAAELGANQEVDGLAPIKVLRRLSGGWRRGGEHGVAVACAKGGRRPHIGGGPKQRPGGLWAI
jgi:hypothetical protein